MANSFTENDLSSIEEATQQIGREILGQVRNNRPGIFKRAWWDDRIMAKAMDEPSVKVQAFRFVDVLPVLHTPEAVTEHIQEYFEDVRPKLPAVARMGLSMAPAGSWRGNMAAKFAKSMARAQAQRFIAGSTKNEVLKAAGQARKEKMAFTLDLLGEAVLTEVEADRYFQAYLDLVRNLSPSLNAESEIPQIDRDPAGPLPRVNVSIKPTALDSQFDPVDYDGTKRRVSARVRELFRAARECKAFINVDMESYSTKDLTLDIFKSVLMEDEFRDFSDVGIVIQCYLRDSGNDLHGLRDWARQRGTPVWTRLVKGAYWDYETIHARYEGWPIPVYQQKWESDLNFEEQTRFLLANYEYLRPALGSHNVRSIAHGLAAAKHLGLPDNALELQMLYGMANTEKRVLVDRGHRLRVYMPYGELIPGMAYLVRRLLENTSDDSFLKASYVSNTPVEKLLQNPANHKNSQPSNNSPSGNGSDMSTATAADFPVTKRSPLSFSNEPLADFAEAECRQKMQDALAQVAPSMDGHYPIVIGGQKIETQERLPSFNPSHKAKVVGSTSSATVDHANQAVEVALAAFESWGRTNVKTRAEFLRKTAAEMRRRRYELAAWQINECGKNWKEADGDVCEAIDFCEYYATAAIALQGDESEADVPGEENRMHYIPRGVTGIISPWNFPLAILTGMTVAALATGNTVIMKPAQQSSVIAAKLMEIFEAVGLPPGVANYLPGRGSVAGARLVDHPQVALIAFTGSRSVGLDINIKAAQVSAEGTTRDVKRVIAEMGGKNAVIIDADADLDEAVAGVVYSAFGYQGQKCSACSRVIVLEGNYDNFVERLIEATRSMKVGPAEDPENRVGPVIDAGAFKSIHEYIKAGQAECTEALGADLSGLEDEGFYIAPRIFTNVSPNAKIAQEEIFGPVLAVIKAKDLDEAFKIANDTDYALTGGMFSRSPANLERAARELMVGNIYLNRSITGALVCRQPFGGFRMSGIGSKAGGPDYLLQFVLPRTVTENTMRRGFAPMED
ncbi:MAG: L-glutamate gamma-semialdehyde dehydrogenase [Pirellulales bacterium]|nr:L-glutamate gamma-semialdehyde dehydrogenase [Pirellulales bacterium]